jgi:HTH-type transcriptional regulator, glycine betaine synthesis regulator
MTDSSSSPEKIFRTVNDSVLHGLGQLASYFGFTKVMGQLYGALLLSPEPLSLDDLMEQLSISKASVSTHVRTLERMGTVREAWVKDDRRKYYQAESDFWRILSNILSSRELRDVNRAINVLRDDKEKLEAAMPDMDSDQQAQAQFYIERLEQLTNFFQLAQLLITSIIAHAQQDPDIGDIKRIDFE